jgi:electron transfer flavoprotein alpha/beta subunit
MAAKGKPVAEVTPNVEVFASAPKIERVYMPLKTKQTQILGNGDAKAGAVELVEKLRSEVRVI